ncbi:MAG TPA: hypothetical protein VI338_03670, partial [Nitrososphaera sp.]|nr:hypothetical protein [Nitrososphaera sp.]
MFVKEYNTSEERANRCNSEVCDVEDCDNPALDIVKLEPSKGHFFLNCYESHAVEVPGLKGPAI